MGRDLRRKSTKTVPALVDTEFAVSTEAFLSALRRVSSALLMDGIKPEVQNILVTAEVPSQVVVEGGSQGSYARVELPAQVSKSGYFTTHIEAAQIRYGSDTIFISASQAENKISYKSKLRGYFVSSGKPTGVTRNRPPKMDPPIVLERESLEAAFKAAYFKAEAMDDHSEVMAKIEVRKGSGPGKKKKNEIVVTIHDRYRVATSIEECSGSEMEARVVQAPLLWRFIQMVPKDVKTVDFLVTDSFVYVHSGDYTAVSPLVYGEVRNIEEWAAEYKEKDSEFSFTIGASALGDVVSSVSSVHVKGDEESRLKLRLKSGKLSLLMNSIIGSAHDSVKVDRGTEGGVDMDSILLSDSLSIFRKENPTLRFMVWSSMIRMQVMGRHSTLHYFSSMHKEG
jgi:DNA polymerase III sliding clamp (beta) subunit (PCNA family)